jgi:superfamily II helicase
MAKSKTADDWRRYKKFEQENEKLRKEVSKLRKIISTMVADQLEDKVKKSEIMSTQKIEVCEICGNDDLYSIPITRTDGIFELKVCESCGNRNKLQRG